MRRAACLLLAALPLALAACSSSSGGSGGSAPARTYIIEPNGQAVPTTVPAGESSEGGTSP